MTVLELLNQIQEERIKYLKMNLETEFLNSSIAIDVKGMEKVYPSKSTEYIGFLENGLTLIIGDLESEEK